VSAVSELVVEQLELCRPVWWGRCERVIAVEHGGLVLRDDLPALEDETDEIHPDGCIVNLK